MVAQWGHVPAWTLYGGDPLADWAPWYEVVCEGVESAQAELNKPKSE